MTNNNLVIGLLFLFLSVTIHAETYTAPLVDKSLLLDAAVSQNTIVVGERGHVILSTDGGASFTQLTLPLVTTLTTVATIGEKIWVAGHDATIMFSDNSGQDWDVQMHSPDLERPFLDILFFDESHGIAAGAYGLFYRTIDGGENWVSEQHQSLLNPLDIEYLEEIRVEDEAFYLDELSSILPHLNRITRHGDALYVAGETGLLAVSNNLGRSWQRYEIDYAGSFFDILPLNNETTLAAGLRGTVYLKYRHHNWKKINTCTTATLNSIMLSTENTVLIVGNNGVKITIDLQTLLQSPDAPCVDNGLNTAQLSSKSAIATVIKTSNGFTAITSDGLQLLGVE
jgi:photosystem II stability/assembly factor-like uncharacterized protein